jgi:hypothetical protein
MQEYLLVKHIGMYIILTGQISLWGRGEKERKKEKIKIKNPVTAWAH